MFLAEIWLNFYKIRRGIPAQNSRCNSETVLKQSTTVHFSLNSGVLMADTQVKSTNKRNAAEDDN